MPRSKKEKKGDVLKNVEGLSGPPENPLINPPHLLQKPFVSITSWILPLLLIAALYFFINNRLQLGEILLAVAGIFLTVGVFYTRRPPWIAQIINFLGPMAGVGLIGILWGSFSLVMLTFPNFNWAAPARIQSIPFQQSYWALFWLFAGMVVAFRLLPEEEKSPQDISPWAARLWLLAALGIGGFLSLYHADVPIGSYWEDNDLELPRYVADMHDYHWSFIFFGHGEPFANWVQIILFWLLPGVSSIVVEKIAGASVFLALVWILYLIGKEIGGRRVGVLAAALGSISKPVILKVLWAVRLASLPLGPALALLFFFRLIKKPDFSHFLQWGLALAFGIYTYSPYRPFVPFMVFLTLGWVFFHEKKHDLHWSRWILLGTSMFVFLIYFAYTNVLLPVDSWLTRLLATFGISLSSLVLGGLFVLTIIISTKMPAEEKDSKLMGWLAGAWICAIISFPIMCNDSFLFRMRSDEQISGTSTLFARILTRGIYRLEYIFWRGFDREDMAIDADAFFGYSEVILIALGLAYSLARPKFGKVVLLLSALVGLAPHIVSAGEHSGRALGCIPPLFILGALGLNQVLTGVCSLPKGRALFKLLIPCLAVFWFWSARSTLSRVYDQYSEKYFHDGCWMRMDALKAMAEGNRVYLDDGIEHSLGPTLYEGHPVFKLWADTNIIFIGPNEKPPHGVVVYVFPPHLEIPKKISKMFPTAQWSDIHNPNRGHENEFYAHKCFIPFDDVVRYSQEYLKKQGKNVRFSKRAASEPPFLEVRQVVPPYWKRDYSPIRMGLTFGFNILEDKVVDSTSTPRPNFDTSYTAVRYEGIIHVKETGKYQMDWSTDNLTRLRVDGRQILNIVFSKTDKYMDPPSSGKKNIYLKAGDHNVEVLTVFQRSRVPPNIVLRREGLLGDGKSLWSSFDF